MAEGGLWRDKSGHERVPRNSGLNSSRSLHFKFQGESASVETCKVMNLLGYGPEIRQARRDAYREYDRLINTRKGGTIVITAGSKAEGLTSLFESDWDHMFVMYGFMCLEDGVNCCTLPRETNVFTLNNRLCYPGHSRLNLDKRSVRSINTPFWRDALWDDENGNFVLRSDWFVNMSYTAEYATGEVRLERAGPSRPTLCGPLLQDMVLSLHCHCPGILLRWAERSRHWPPPDIVFKVVKMGAFVAPVGFKGSAYKHIEWRICFNIGETELVCSLNNVQVYIYILLKMVVKDALKPVNKEISSYTVKNIVFWLAENNQQERFNERSFFYWLREALEQLRTAILKIHLPYYMIPERNLMAACGLDEKQKSAWVETITDMMNEGEKILFRLPKIRKAIISHPEPLLWYNKRRIELELVELMTRYRDLYCTDENGVVNKSDPMLQALKRRINEILREVRQRMNCDGSGDGDPYEIFKMMLM